METASDRAAEILAKSRAAVITGTGTDVAGARAAFRLAARLGGAVDFCRSPGAANFYALMADKGLLFTTPREARVRADVLLLVGPAAGRSEVVKHILTGQPVASAGDAPREVVWLCSGGAGNALSNEDVMKVGGDVAALPGILSVLSACVNARPIPEEYGGLSRKTYEEIAGRLMTARFGVVAWSSSDLDALAAESLLNTTAKLNQTTRLTMLPVGAQSGEQTAGLVSAWTTGFPPRTGFARGFPEYDPWRFDAARLVSSGECDAIVWVSSFEATPPGWTTTIPTIAITAPGTIFPAPPAVLIETAVPGLDTNAEFYDETLQALVHAKSGKAADALTPSAVLEGILTKLEAIAA